jgi:RHS repeat-associated protein
MRMPIINVIDTKFDTKLGRNMHKKLLGIIVTTAVVLTGFTGEANIKTAVAEVKTNQSPPPSVEAPQEEKLQELDINVSETTKPIKEVTLSSNVEAVSAEYPITIVDTNDFSVLKTCSEIAECSIEVDSNEHPEVKALSGEIESDSVSLAESSSEETAPDSPPADSALGVDLTITNPLFETGETFSLDTLANTDLTDSGYGVYVFDTSNDVLVGSFQSGTSLTLSNLSFNANEEQKEFQAYIANWVSPTPSRITDLENIQATSGVVIAYKAPWEIDITLPNSVFPSHETSFSSPNDPNISISWNQTKYSSKDYLGYLVRTDTNEVVNYYNLSYGSGSFNAYFTDGPTRHFKFFVASKDQEATNFTQLKNIQGQSNVVEATRQAWTLDTEVINSAIFPVSTLSYDDGTAPKINFSYNQEIYWSNYTFYVARVDTNEVIYMKNPNASGKSSQFNAYYTGGNSSRTYRGYIALKTNSEVHNVSDLQDIQAVSEPVQVVRKPWSLSVAYSTSNADRDFYRVRLNISANQKITWSDYQYVIQDVNSGTYSAIPPYYNTENIDAGGYPYNQTKSFRVYVGVPIYDQDRNVIGVKDIQGVSNTVMASDKSLVNKDGSTNSDLFGGSNPSQNCAQGCEGDPINTLTGEFWEQSQDVVLENVGVPLTFIRNYGSSSASTNNNKMGYGWTHNYNMRITNPTDDSFTNLPREDFVEIEQENGSTVVFSKTPEGEYSVPSNILASLKYSSDSDTFTFQRNSGEIFVFSALNGKLLSQQDIKGNKLLLSYNSASELQKITADNGNFIELSYNSNGAIRKVLDSSSYYIEYVYDSEENLVSVSDNQGIIKKYTYDDHHKVLSLADAENGITKNEYSNDKVVKQTDPEGNEIKFDYSFSGTATTIITESNGSKKYQEYDKNGRLFTEVTGYGSDTPYYFEYRYSPTGLVSSVRNPDNSWNYYSYDVKGNRTSATDGMGRPVYYSDFTETGAPRVIQDAYGHKTETMYSPNGSVSSVKDALGNSLSYVTNSKGIVEKYISPSGSETDYFYDNKNTLSKIVNANEQETRFVYDAAGNILSNTNSLGYSTKSTFDARGNLLSKTDPEGNTSSIIYDDNNRPVTFVNALSDKATVEYDLNHNIIKEIDTLGNSITFKYDASNNVISKTDALGNTTTYEYDIYNNNTVIRDPLGNETKFTYDWRGNITSTTSPEGRITTNIYDYSGKLIESYDPANNKTSYEYDYTLAANLTKVTDSQNKVTLFNYDANGNMISTTKSDGSIESWTYNANNEKVSYVNSSNQTSTYTYNNINELVESNVSGIKNAYEYDKSGNLIKRVDNDLSSTSYQYDKNNLLTSVTYSNQTSPDTEYKYDSLNRKVEMKDKSGISKYYYDDLSRLVNVEKNNASIKYTYDAINQTSITSPSGEKTNYKYNSLNQLESLSSSGLKKPILYSYNKDKQIQSMNYNNGIKGNYTYGLNSIVNKINYSNSDENISTHEYNYNSLNLITNKDISGSTDENNQYNYDSLNRVKDKNNISGYSYDSNNNLLSNPNQESYSYDSVNNRLLNITNPDNSQNTNYEYDTRGNRISISSEKTNEEEKVTNYSYNLSNQLIEVNPENSSDYDSLIYSYDGNGLLNKRIKTTTQSSSTEEFIWDTNRSISTLLEDDKKKYIYDTNSLSPVAQIDKEKGEVEYLHVDNIDSVVSITDTDGNEVSHSTYDEYGTKQANSIGINKSLFGYAGQYLDQDTGYYYLRARWYDPKAASFITVDPKLIETNLPYGYTAGNPLQYTDPLGLDWQHGFYGIADGISGGIYSSIVNRIAPGTIQLCSTAYQWATGIATIASLFIPVTAPLKIAGAMHLAMIAPVGMTVGKAALSSAVLAAPAVTKVVSTRWQVGDHIGKQIYSKATNTFRDPKWSAVRTRFWKNEAADAEANPGQLTKAQIQRTQAGSIRFATNPWKPDDIARMKTGKPPKKHNQDKEDVDGIGNGDELMELSHEPVPQRDGGLLEVIMRWPQEHAAVDSRRRVHY